MCKIERRSDRRRRAYSSSLTGNFCFKAGWVMLSSNSTNLQGIGCIETSQNWSLWFRSTRRMPGTEVFVLQTWRNAIGEMTWEICCLTVKISYPLKGEHIYVALCGIEAKCLVTHSTSGVILIFLCDLNFFFLTSAYSFVQTKLKYWKT